MKKQVAFSVQSFYAWRISIISGTRLPSILIMLISVVSLALSIVVAVTTKLATTFDNLFTKSIFAREATWQATAAICDIMIAVCMTYYLKMRAPDREQFVDTNIIVTRIVRLTIETGSLTASVAVITVALSYVRNHPAYFSTPILIISNLYATTLLVVLNSRIKLRVKSLSWKDDEPEPHCPIGTRSSFRFELNTESTPSMVPPALEE